MRSTKPASEELADETPRARYAMVLTFYVLGVATGAGIHTFLSGDLKWLLVTPLAAIVGVVALSRAIMGQWFATPWRPPEVRNDG